MADQRFAKLGHDERLAVWRGDHLQAPPVAGQLAADRRTCTPEPLVRPRHRVEQHWLPGLYHRLLRQVAVGARRRAAEHGSDHNGPRRVLRVDRNRLERDRPPAQVLGLFVDLLQQLSAAERRLAGRLLQSQHG